MITIDAPIAPVVHDAVATFCSLLDERYRLRVAAIYVLGRRMSDKSGMIGGVDVTVIFDGEISVDDRMAIADLAAAASEQSGVQVRQWPVSAFEWSHPETYCNPSLIAKTKRSGVPAEFVVDGQADRRAGSPRPDHLGRRGGWRSGGAQDDFKH